MAVYWNWWGVPGLVAIVMALVAAAVVYLAAPTAAANRRLSLVLFVEGAAIGGGAGIIYFMGTEGQAYAAQAVSITATLLLPSLYLLLLALLDTPITRFLRRRAVVFLVLAIALASEIFWFVRPELFIPEMSGPGTYVYTRWEAEWGDTYRNFRYFALVVYLYGFVASILALRTAQGELAQRRAKAFAWAFGIRDVFQVLFIFLFLAVPRWAGRLPDWYTGTSTQPGLYDWLSTVGFPAMVFLFIPFLAYAIVRAQILDIDVKIKWTISRGTIAFVFLGVFVVVAQLAQNFLSEQLGWLAGGVTAGILLFVMTPIQRMAENLADKAMPGVKPLAQLSHPERLNLYREQVKFAWSDGTLSKKERVLLDNLRERLGVALEEATRVEIEITRA